MQQVADEQYEDRRWQSHFDSGSSLVARREMNDFVRDYLLFLSLVDSIFAKR